MTMKQARSLLVGASLCLPLAACHQKTDLPEVTSASATVATEAVPPETTVQTVPETQALTMPELSDSSFVPVTDYIPDMLVELKYASQDNFTGQTIYEFEDAFARFGTVKKLAEVQESLHEVGLGLKIWDAFRPVAAQFRLWEVCPDDTYVADPRKGYSNHSRGNAVDVALVDLEGREVEMPTQFDDFSGKADRNYADCTETAADNARLLQDVMQKHGFVPYYGEWWHFADEEKYPVEEVFEPVRRTQYRVKGQEAVLWAEPDEQSQVVTLLSEGEDLEVLGWYADYALVRFGAVRGYTQKANLEPVS